MKKIIKNPLLREFSFFGSSTLLFQISRVLVELTAAKLLGPVNWGIWYLLNLVIAYRGLISFGIDNGMNREVPINLGKGNKTKAVDLQNITFTSLIYTSLIGCSVIFIASFLLDDIKLRRALWWLIPLFIANQFYYFLSMSLKATSLFAKLSKKQVIFSISFPLTALPLTYLFGLVGFIAGFTISLLVSSLYIYVNSPINYNFKFDLQLSLNLMKIGFPIMAVGIAYAFFNTVDRWIIGLLIGTEELGYYSMSIIVFGGMTLFPKVISQQLYPRMAYDWGKSKSVDKLLFWTRQQTKYTALLIIPLLLFALIIFPFIIKNWLPDYTQGITALKIILLGTISMPLSAGWGNIMNILDKQIYYLSIIVFGVLLNLFLNYLLVIMGFGINGVAAGTTITFFIYNLLIYLMGKYIISNLKIDEV